MATDDILGAVAELGDNTVGFSATHQVTGTSGHGHFSLTQTTGFRQYLQNFARVQIIGDSLTASIRGPITANVASTLDVCIIPTDHNIFPTTSAQIATVQGNTSAQHSLLVGVQTAAVRFANGITNQIKPEGLIGSLPEVCFFFHINGGAATDTAVIIISGRLSAHGIGFVQTW
jgi:hypothetical protein